MLSASLTALGFLFYLLIFSPAYLMDNLESFSMRGFNFEVKNQSQYLLMWISSNIEIFPFIRGTFFFYTVAVAWKEGLLQKDTCAVNLLQTSSMVPLVKYF